MSCREIKEDGVGVGLYRFADGGIDAIGHWPLDIVCHHERIGFAIGELSDNKAFDARQDARHTQIVHHAIDVVMAFADVFDEENNAFGMCVYDVIEVIGRALQAVENAEITSDERALGLSVTVERMGGTRI